MAPRKQTRRTKGFGQSSPPPLRTYTLKGYRIRESQRAKRITIKVSTKAEVEVVVPPQCDRQRLTRFLEAKQDWIEATIRTMQFQRQERSDETQALLPSTVLLRSLTEEWTITYEPTAEEQITIQVPQPLCLTLRGAVSDQSYCQFALQHWVRQKAKYHLEPWLREVSQEVKLPCNAISIRRQKTRWASCSTKYNISLNDKLLFLPPELVRYVFIHELCHTQHMNHSAEFWALVASKEPQYQQWDQALRDAWKFVPDWLTTH
ncbi:MAG: SprT family zinc-dependent metalloprotease [Synechococcales bacterium]|nr:SprT family zinc-dependent metalloprotease [Synechococcales bacterium]